MIVVLLLLHCTEEEEEDVCPHSYSAEKAHDEIKLGAPLLLLLLFFPPSSPARDKPFCCLLMGKCRTITTFVMKLSMLNKKLMVGNNSTTIVLVLF